MSLLAAVLVALTALRVNALRSFLAILGVIFGVAAVITTVSLAQGARDAVETRIASLGANTLSITAGSRSRGGRQDGAGSARPSRTPTSMRCAPSSTSSPLPPAWSRPM